MEKGVMAVKRVVTIRPSLNKGISIKDVNR